MITNSYPYPSLPGIPSGYKGHVPIRLALVGNKEEVSYITRCEVAREVRSALNTYAYTVGFSGKEVSHGQQG